VLPIDAYDGIGGEGDRFGEEGVGESCHAENLAIVHLAPSGVP
jgi:hypothetical protein